ncbi:MAG: ferrous iron transporter B [Firmicutes bacterium]|nr:ferrous iron transporter B [Bacillota bacterium]
MGITLHHQEEKALGKIIRKAEELRRQQDENIHDKIVSTIYAEAEILSRAVVSSSGSKRDWDRLIDDLVTSKIFGYPLMLLLLGMVFWITIIGANYPSALLADLFWWLEERLTALFLIMGAPLWLHGLAVQGIYRGLAWVVAVMLPPMAIFFPIFTLLEDLGYLPRVAFNLDRIFKKVGAHGKQALTMSMGFGCNAAGVIAARIIDSPRERMIAILTNNFVPCNGRFPILIIISTMFVGTKTTSRYGNIAASAMVIGLVLVGISATFFVSWALSKTILKGKPSLFTLELPPYRKPQVVQVIARSFLDRTVFVLGRAVIVAAPAGAIIWIMANVFIGDISFIRHATGWLEPFGQALGLDGVIVLAFLLGLPANEIVIPIMLMCYFSAGAMLELDSISALRDLLIFQGWTGLTALNVMLFSLLHFPCGTTLFTIGKETGSFKWPAVAAAITTAIAVAACFLTAQAARLLALV